MFKHKFNPKFFEECRNESVLILNFRLCESSVFAQIHPRSQMVSPVASQSASFGTVEAQCCVYPQGGFLLSFAPV